MEWLALTDRDNVTGAVRFAKSCAAHGVRPIFGVDLRLLPRGLAEVSRLSPALGRATATS
ncbi:PHP domain-containing protein [Streptomyces sp. NPDC059837]|uniref:PHP domain-containing protein n=1 Tax=Streptomyces sp. NPDC059837 TaxID=3346968 RepID=UPI0036523614